MSKRIKSSVEELLKNAKPIDMSDYYQRRDEERKRAEEKYRNELKEEKERVEKMTCPLCKSKNKERNVSTISNGVMGTGYHSKKIADHYICMDCGIHYSDLNKKEIVPPSRIY